MGFSGILDCHDTLNMYVVIRVKTQKLEIKSNCQIKFKLCTYIQIVVELIMHNMPIQNFISHFFLGNIMLCIKFFYDRAESLNVKIYQNQMYS